MHYSRLQIPQLHHFAHQKLQRAGRHFDGIDLLEPVPAHACVVLAQVRSGTFDKQTA